MIIASYFIDIHQREEFFVLYNKRGNNGKSTLINAIQKVFGNFFYSCKSALLTEQKNDNAEAASPFLSGMKHKRFISFQEIKSTSVLESNQVKILSGGDIIYARKLQKDGE